MHSSLIKVKGEITYRIYEECNGNGCNKLLRERDIYLMKFVYI